jgi:hypothetical protein
VIEIILAAILIDEPHGFANDERLRSITASVISENLSTRLATSGLQQMNQYQASGCHSLAGGNPVESKSLIARLFNWIPACAGMTASSSAVALKQLLQATTL